MKTFVISVGGSAIVPDEIDVAFLRRLKKTVFKLSKRNKLVVVCGGGKVARDYIKAAKAFGVHDRMASLAGIRSTKLNATLVSLIIHGNVMMPDSLSEVKRELRTRNVVVIGALGFKPGMTSDGDAAEVAAYLRAKMFINVTDVLGLYDKNPKKYKDAKFIPRISFDDFWNIASKIKFKAGQHFVLDKAAAKIIKKHKIKTVIVKGMNNFEKVVLGRKYTGTTIE
jgi:uridylate kinase